MGTSRNREALSSHCDYRLSRLVLNSIITGSVNHLPSINRFIAGQRWLNNNAVKSPFLGEVIEASAQGQWGTVVITDHRGNVLDTYIGTAAAFQASGEWHLIEE
jgi:hypothetical protein